MGMDDRTAAAAKPADPSGRRGRTGRGDPGDRVVVDAPDQDERSRATIGGFPFEVGQEYLVSASQGTVAVCPRIAT